MSYFQPGVGGWLRLEGSGRQGCEHELEVCIVGSRNQATLSEGYNKLRSIVGVVEICTA
jgi:hypothetical protein